MTIDDAGQVLDCSDDHVKDMIRDGDLAGIRRDRVGRLVKYSKPLGREIPHVKAGEWWVAGADVRARKRRLAK